FVLVPIVTLAVVAGFVWYRITLGSTARTDRPERINWCDRTYLGGYDSVTRAQIEAEEAALPGDRPYPVVTVTHLGGRPVLAAVTPEARRQPSHLPCTMVLYLETAPDRYAPYVLSGGP